MTIIIVHRSQQPMELSEANCRQWRLMTDAKHEPRYRVFRGTAFCKLGAALLFAIMLAMATNASFVQGLRFISAICLLISSWHFGVALVRQRPLSGLSEWGEAAIFSLVAGCAHLFGYLLG